MIDPYQALGVAKGASDKEIKSAYRKLAKELHPDKNKDNPKATERFSDVTRAYDLLLDKDKRAQFDRWRRQSYRTLRLWRRGRIPAPPGRPAT